MSIQENASPRIRGGGASPSRRLLNYLRDASSAMNMPAYPFLYYRSARSLQLPDRQAERDRR
jgi:hypothetical protein